jgi:hypothetical protein
MSHETNAVSTLLAGLLNQAAANLVHWIRCTSPDILTWTPGDPACSKSRSIIEFANECIDVNTRFGAAAKNQPIQGGLPASDDIETIIEGILSSAKSFGDTLIELGDSRLEETREIRIGSLPVSALAKIAMANMYYHGGQVNAYQLMRGDTEFTIAQV